MHLLGRQEREARGQVESHLPAERGQRAGSGAVGFLVPMIEHVTHEIEVGLHRRGLGATGIIAPYSRVLAAGSRARPKLPPRQMRNRRSQTPTPENRSRAATPASGL